MMGFFKSLQFLIMLIAGLCLVGEGYCWEEYEWSEETEQEVLQMLSHYWSYIDNLSFSPDGNKIAFTMHSSSDPESPSDIYIVDIHSKQVVNLTNTPDVDEGGKIAWSPDGSLIAYEVITYEVNPSGQKEEKERYVWLMDADGRNRRLASDRPCYSPVWSPDGEYLVVGGIFEGDLGRECALLLLTSQGEEVSMLTGGYAIQEPLAWSPDGRYIIFRRYAPPVFHDVICRYDVSTKEILQLTSDNDGPTYVRSAYISPDSSTILYIELDGSIWTIDINGNNKMRYTLPQLPEEVGYADPWEMGFPPVAISPNWQKIAFIGVVDDPSCEIYPHNIYLINPDGTGLEQITFFNGFLAKGKGTTALARAGKSSPAGMANQQGGKAISHGERKVSSVDKQKKERKGYKQIAKQMRKQMPSPQGENPRDERPTNPPALPLAAGALSLSALGYAVWKFLKLLV